MRRSLLMSFLFIALYSPAQAPQEAKEGFRHIISMISQDSVARLAQYISYPLHRPNPIPDIRTPAEFAAYYHILIDSGFKRKLRSYDDSVIFEHYTGYGLVGGTFSGDIWINYEANAITTINYESAREKTLADSITSQIQRRIHSSVNKWNTNMLVWRAKSIIVRVDNTDRGLRYTSWTHGQSISDKPDLILYGGKEEGGSENWSYIFNNGQWRYELQDRAIGSGDDDMGLFLEVFYEDASKSRIRMRESK